METNFSEKYARRLTPEKIQRSPSKHFLPLFGVPKIAGGLDLRLVFDAAAKPHGRCLNDFVTSVCVSEPLACHFDPLQRRSDRLVSKYGKDTERTPYKILIKSLAYGHPNNLKEVMKRGGDGIE
jgi:hypothetical protein